MDEKVRSAIVRQFKKNLSVKNSDCNWLMYGKVTRKSKCVLRLI